MRLLLLMSLLSFRLAAQDISIDEVALSGGYEYHGWRAHGWNITANATRQFEKNPRLFAGFSLAYGISEFNNRRSGTIEVAPTFPDVTMPVITHSNFPDYARKERVRLGVECAYSLMDKGKHQFSAGLGLAFESLLRHKENGVEVWAEMDTTTNSNTYSSTEYAFDHRTNEIKNQNSFFVVPHFTYTYHINHQFGVFLRSSLFVRVQRDIRYGGYLQNNLGLSFSW